MNINNPVVKNIANAQYDRTLRVVAANIIAKDIQSLIEELNDTEDRLSKVRRALKCLAVIDSDIPDVIDGASVKRLRETKVELTEKVKVIGAALSVLKTNRARVGTQINSIDDFLNNAFGDAPATYDAAAEIINMTVNSGSVYTIRTSAEDREYHEEAVE